MRQMSIMASICDLSRYLAILCRS